MSTLALYGGEPIRKKAWPVWPPSDPEVEEEVLRSLRSQRWTISGLYNGNRSYEERFSNAFAKYNSGKFCIPTANGTSALICAMQAMGIGSGDEVIVPGLTWVACAIAVVKLNAIPVFVDVNESTLCLSPSRVEEAITGRTRAIMAVHLYSAICDLDNLLQISEKYNIPLIEDCAQAHGAIWRGQRVGTIGKIGTFSMQQGKILTSGEGGACITNDSDLAGKIYAIRTNGRSRLSVPPAAGYMELTETGNVFASNYCLSEIQCAILLARLNTLDYENNLRKNNKLIFETFLKEVEGLSLQKSSQGTEAGSMYHLPVKIDLSEFNHAGIETICKALSAELNTWIHQPYAPLNKNPLYDPSSLKWYGDKKDLDAGRFNLPVSLDAHNTHFLLHHSLFLGTTDDMEMIIEGIKKVKQHVK